LAEKTGGAKARVFIVDDHPIVRQGLSELISHELDLEVCGEAVDADCALGTIDDAKPDVVVLDISLGKGMGGVELIKEIKARHEDVKMIAWSMHDEKLYAERCLSAGALGYISKEAPPEDFLAALRKVLSGKVYLSENMSDRLLSRIAKGTDELQKPSIEALSDRELEVFELIGKGMTTRQIAQNLHLSVKTVETYRENLKVKLNLPNSTELVRHAVQWNLEGN
jgi:DNA-binding NarL/FixJ family response regulator